MARYREKLAGLGILSIASIAVLGIGRANFNRLAKSKVEELFKDQRKTERKVVTDADLEGLPEPVQRYLRYTGVVGREKVTSVRLKQKGFMRQGPDQDWKPLKAVEYFSTTPPGFVWMGTMNMAPLLAASAQDMYLNGKGNMLVKLLSTVTVVDAKGYDMDYSSLMRYFNEAMWFPTAYLDDAITWEQIDSNTVRGTMTDHGITVSAEFSFNEKGELKNFVADRYRSVGRELVMEKWSTPISEYKMINGMHLPVKGEAIWHLSSGDFPYIKLDVTEIEFNNPSLY